MALPTISHAFGIVADPEFGTTPSGKNFAKIRLGASARKYNEQTSQWETTANFYTQATAWEQDAEKIRNLGIKQGDQVQIEGQLVTESWEKDGQKQSKTALRLRGIRRFEKSQNSQQGNTGGFQPPVQQVTPQPNGGGQWGGTPAQGDPWSSGGNNQPQQGNNGGWGSPSNDEPAF